MTLMIRAGLLGALVAMLPALPAWPDIYYQDRGVAWRENRQYSSDSPNQSCVVVRGQGTCLELWSSIISKWGDALSFDYTDSSRLAVGMAGEAGASANLHNCTISTDGLGAHGVVAHAGFSCVYLDKCSVTCKKDRSSAVISYNNMWREEYCAIMDSYVDVYNTNLLTLGDDSPAIRTGPIRGFVVTGISSAVSTSGLRSPAILSQDSGCFSANDTVLKAEKSEAVRIEGTPRSSICSCSVVTESGDCNAIVFTDQGGVLWVRNSTVTAPMGPAILATAARVVLYLDNSRFVVPSGIILEIRGSDSYGRPIPDGAEGGVIFVAGTTEGDLVVDELSSLDVAFGWLVGSTEPIRHTGAINAGNTAKQVKVNFVESTDCMWTVTKDSYIGILEDDFAVSGESIRNITGNGHNVYYDPMFSENCYLAGNAFALVNGGQLKPTTGPSVLLKTTVTSPTNLGLIPVSVTFRWDVTGLDASDLLVTNGVVVSVEGGGSKYVANIVPLAAGPVTVTVPEGVTAPPRGLGNLASNTLSITYDPPIPDVTLSTRVGNPTNRSPFPVAIRFTAAVTGFVPSDIRVTNGTVTSLSGSGTDYVAQITPSVNGIVTVEVPAGVAVGLGGTQNTASAPLSRTYDNASPTVSLASTLAPTVSGPIAVAATLSLPTTEFTLADIITDNATVAAFSGNGTNYRFTLIPILEGAFSCWVRRDAFSDSAGNGSIPSDPLERRYDAPPLTVTLTSALSGPTNLSPMLVTVTFCRPVTDFAPDDITVTGATVGLVTGSGTTYSVGLIPAAENVKASVLVLAGGVRGPADEPNEISNTLSLIFDSVPPNAPFVRGPMLSGDGYPAWTWSSGGEGNGNYRYRLDGTTGAWQESTDTSFTRTGVALSDGQHTIYVQECDEAGNWSASGCFTTVIDTTPPNTPRLIAQSPTGDRRPQWNWVSGGPDGVGAYRYSLDSEGHPWVGTDQTSYVPESALPVGAHTLYVQERDICGNWSLSGTYTVAVVPEVAISGRVTWGSAGLAGVSLDGLPSQTTTDADGTFHTTVLLGWSGRITARRAGYVFEPETRPLCSVTEEQAGQDFAALCADLGTPQDIHASDGTFAQYVRVTWSAAEGAAGYNVYRCDSDTPSAAQRIGRIPATSLSFDDTTAKAASHPDTGGCNPGKASTTYYRHYYWVRAVNECSEGDFSVSDSGYRGLAEAKDFAAVTLNLTPTSPDEAAPEACVTSPSATEAGVMPRFSELKRTAGDALVLAAGLSAIYLAGPYARRRARV